MRHQICYTSHRCIIRLLVFTCTGREVLLLQQHNNLVLLPGPLSTMATCASSCSRWGILNEIGITEDDLLNILVRGDCSAVNKLHGDIPTYGLVIELFYFADEVAESLHRRPNHTKVPVGYQFHSVSPICYKNLHISSHGIKGPTE